MGLRLGGIVEFMIYQGHYTSAVYASVKNPQCYLWRRNEFNSLVMTVKLCNNANAIHSIKKI